MSYARRWVYACVCVLAVMTVGYFADLQFLLAKYAEIAGAENKLREHDVSRRQSSIINKSYVQNSAVWESKYLRRLFMIMQKYRINVHEINRVASGEITAQSGEDYQLILGGEYNDIYRLLNDFDTSTDDYLIKNVVLQTDKDQQLQIELMLRIEDKVSGGIVKNDNKTSVILNPFCDLRAADYAVKNTLTTFPLSSMQVLGVVIRNKLRYAIIRLPDAAIKEVGVGDQLGLENGHVENISDVSLTIILPDQMRKVM